MRNIDNFRRALHNGLEYRDPFFLNFDKKSLKTVKTMKLPQKSRDDLYNNIDDYNNFIDYPFTTTVNTHFLSTATPSPFLHQCQPKVIASVLSLYLLFLMTFNITPL